MQRVAKMVRYGVTIFVLCGLSYVKGRGDGSLLGRYEIVDTLMMLEGVLGVWKENYTGENIVSSLDDLLESELERAVRKMQHQEKHWWVSRPGDYDQEILDELRIEYSRGVEIQREEE